MLTGKELNQQIRQVGFIVILAALLCLIVYELKYFISAFLGAFTLYMLLRGPHRRLTARGWNKTLTSALLVVVTILVVFVIGGGVAGLVISKLQGFDPRVIVDKLNAVHDFILSHTGYDLFSKDMVDKAIQSAGNWVPGLFATTGSILVNGFLMLVVLFFMLQAREQLERSTAMLPLSPHSICLLGQETKNMVVSNAIGIPIVVAGQAVVSGLGYWMLDAGNPVVWGVLTGVMGLVPVVGSASVWGLLAVNLMVGGQVWQGIVLVLYGALITSNVDNLIRMVLLKRYADVHPAVTLFGIILGLNLFGFWGIIFGPLLIDGFRLLVKIYRNEFLKGHVAAPGPGPKENTTVQAIRTLCGAQRRKPKK